MCRLNKSIINNDPENPDFTNERYRERIITQVRIASVRPLSVETDIGLEFKVMKQLKG